jgi:nitrogen fixation NifU-like protein
MLGEICHGRTVEEAQEILRTFIELIKGKRSASASEILGDAVALQGVQNFPARIKCAMLAWEALEKCLEKVQEVK